jgi:hypothetical protein
MPSSETNSQAPTLLMLILLLRSGMLANKLATEDLHVSTPLEVDTPQNRPRTGGSQQT